MNKKEKIMIENLKKIILVCITLVIILGIIIFISCNLKSENKDISDNQIEVEVQKTKEENAKKIEESVVVDKLSNMGERDRIEYYFSQFIKAIEAEKYEKAYNMLYDEFKQNYFNSLEEFENYAKKTFPRMISVDHKNFERNGSVYVLVIDISDSLSASDSSKKEMKFVIKENDINDYVMSFSVI